MRPAPVVFFVLVLTVIVSSLLPMFNHQGKLKPPEVRGRLPAYSLVDARNQPVNENLFDGQLRVLTFFFTSCPEICPRLNRTIKTLADNNPGVKFISITVDPKIDTPERLSQYSRELQASDDQWNFLTGDYAEVQRLQDELKISGGGEPAQHSTRAILVDRHGLVRGLYQLLDADGLAALQYDIKVLETL